MMFLIAKLLNKYFPWNIICIIDEYVPESPCIDFERKNGKTIICSAHAWLRCNNDYCFEDVCICNNEHICSICNSASCLECRNKTHCNHGSVCMYCDVSQCNNCGLNYCRDCVKNIDICAGCNEGCCDECMKSKFEKNGWLLCNTCYEDETFDCDLCFELARKKNKWYNNYMECPNCYSEFCGDCIDTNKITFKCSQCDSTICTACIREDNNKVYCKKCMDTLHG